MSSLMITEEPNEYFKPHKQILKFCGISFSKDESIGYKFYSLIILSTTIFLYSILDTYELFKHDFETSSDLLINVAGFIIAATKVITMLINRIMIGKLLAKLEQEPFVPNPNRGGEEEKALIDECIWKTNFQAQVYWRFAAGSVTVFSLFALSTRIRSNDYHKWQLPYGPFTVLDITYSPNYEITLLYQCICFSVLSAIYGTTDLIIAGVLAHISYQFKVLQNFLRNIVEHSYKQMLKNEGYLSKEGEPFLEAPKNDEIYCKYLEKSIKEAVQYHVAILDLANEIEVSFRTMFLTTFLVTMGALCLEIYEISYQDTARIIRRIMEYMIGSLPIFIICYWGEQILSESEKVGLATYESDFVGTIVEFQRALVMIIRRSQYPTKLTAGKLANICMNTFVWIWKTSYSLCMVLRNINGK